MSNKETKDVKVNNLQVNQIYENYIKMCEVLEEPIKSGRSRTSQIENWARYFKWERIGNKYKILEIYDIVLPQIFTRKKGSKYSDLIYPIIVKLLKNQSIKLLDFPFPTIDGRRDYFYSIFGFTKQLYKDLELELESEILMQSEFRNNCRAIVYEQLMRTIENLSKTERIIYNQHFYIKYVNDNGRYISDKEQDNRINSAILIAVEDMGYSNVNEVYENNEFSELKKRINDHLEFLMRDYRFQSTALEISLPISIENAYNEVFKGKSNNEIDELIKSNKVKINELALNRIYKKNEKEIAEMLAYSSVEKSVIERLNKEDKNDMKTWNIKLKILHQIRKDFGKDLTIAQCTEIYKRYREDFTDQLIKIS